MADALISELNRVGFQPIFLPQTGVIPPELYNLTRKDHRPRLVRRGPLISYLPRPASFQVRRSSLADISNVQSTGKSLSASAGFLTQCLACLGITGLPKLDLNFVGAKKLVFGFNGVTSLRVDPAEIDHTLTHLDLGAIPAEYAEQGFLHIAYEYAFAEALVMRREDGHSFRISADSDIANFIDLGTKASLSLDSSNTVSFRTAKGAEAPAFAYRAGRLMRDTRWRFYPEEFYRSGGAVDARPYVLRRGLVLEAENDDTRDN